MWVHETRRVTVSIRMYWQHNTDNILSWFMNLGYTFLTVKTNSVDVLNTMNNKW